MRDFQSGFEYLSRSKTFLHSLGQKLTLNGPGGSEQANRDRSSLAVIRTLANLRLASLNVPWPPRLVHTPTIRSFCSTMRFKEGYDGYKR